MTERSKKPQNFVDRYTDKELEDMRKKFETPETRAFVELCKRVIAKTATAEEQAIFDERTKECEEYINSKPFYITAD